MSLSTCAIDGRSKCDNAPVTELLATVCPNTGTGIAATARSKDVAMLRMIAGDTVGDRNGLIFEQVIVVNMVQSIIPSTNRFSHEEAMEVYQQAMRETGQVEYVLVDFGGVNDATTSGFARLVLLRKILREHGVDLFVVNLHDRPAQLYEVNRLDSVLPQAPSPN
jgi:anti-anti-sigma regulatory factor